MASYSGISTGTQSSSMASLNPESSSTVMLLIRYTVIKAAIEEVLYSPVAIFLSTSLACSFPRVRCSIKWLSISFITTVVSGSIH